MKKIDFTAIRKYLAAPYHCRKLQKMREKAARHPENLILQVRVGDLLAKMRMEQEAVEVYEGTAQEFIRRDLLAQAIALKKLILRLDPRRYGGEEVLAGLHQQMMEYRETAFTEVPVHMESEAARP